MLIGAPERGRRFCVSFSLFQNENGFLDYTIKSDAKRNNRGLFRIFQVIFF